MALVAHEPSLIVVEDDAEVLREITHALETRFTVRTTSSMRQALAWLQTDASVTVVIAGQVLRSGMGIDLLESARLVRPEVRRVLIADYSNLAALMDGIHKGTIERTIGTDSLHVELAALAAAPPQGARAVR
jgi:ActR/RegA family two-component response regulator